jgi:hypothetical protein
LQKLEAGGLKAELWLVAARAELRGLRMHLQATLHGVGYLKSLAGVDSWEGVKADGELAQVMRSAVGESLQHIHAMLGVVKDLVREGKVERQAKRKMSKRALEECYRDGLAGGAVVEGWLKEGKKREAEEERYGRDKKSRVEEELECVARELGLDFGADA